MTITPRLHDALAAASYAPGAQGASDRPKAEPAGAAMAPLSLTPLAPPRTVRGDESVALPHGGKQGTVPPARLALFERIQAQLLDQVGRRDLGALPPSWAGISGRLSQEEAASAAAALQLIVARVSS